MLGQLLIPNTNNGNIILRFEEDFKHIKMHFSYREYTCIERFYIRQCDLDNFENGDNARRLTITNPEQGVELESLIGQDRTYKFYVECLDLNDTGKYEPFILQITRGYNGIDYSTRASCTPIS